MNDANKRKVEADSLKLLNKITSTNNFDFENEDQNIIFYISGYLGKSLQNSKKCDGCKTLFVKDRQQGVTFQAPTTTMIEWFKPLSLNK